MDLDTKKSNFDMSITVNIRKPPTIIATLLSVLCEKHTRRGLSLVSIRSEIERSRNGKLNKRNYTILKTILRDLLERGFLKKVRGTGLVGRMYLIKKQRDYINSLLPLNTGSNTRITQDEKPTNQELSAMQSIEAVDEPIRRNGINRLKQKVERDVYLDENQTVATVDFSVVDPGYCSTPVSSKILRME